MNMTRKCAAAAGSFCIAGCMVFSSAIAAEKSTIAGRVAADFAGKPEPVLHYAVPAMGESQRLPDAYPEDGVPGGAVNVVVAKDEYEDASFLLWPRRDLGKVQLSLSPLVNDKGEKFPAEDLDLRVVKVWYQNRNAWFSYFGDTGFKLVPELLLHDEDLVRVDAKKTANYARLVDEKGRKSEVWLNPPRGMSNRELEVPWIVTQRFEPMRGDFADATTLQPVALPGGAFKQFMVTVHAKKDAKPGLYRGEVVVGGGRDAKGVEREPFARVPVAVRVLDFALPQPKCWNAPEKDFFVTFYECCNIRGIMQQNGYDAEKAKRQVVNVYRNQVAHNHVVHWIDGGMGNAAYAALDAMRVAGKRMDVHLSCFCKMFGHTGEDETLPQRIADELDRRIGNHNSYIGYGDEQGDFWFKQNRPFFERFQKAGLKFIIAGSDQVFDAAGYFYDWHNIAKAPTDGSTPRLWNNLQNDNRVGWYANHHVGSENPAFNRRQNGLGPYFAGYTALCNYENALGPWNDDSETYRPMVMAYACGDGLLDTLQWEGFREGVDDVRYATLLTDLARTAQKSSVLSTRYLGGQAMQFLAGIDSKSRDLDMVRAEMVDRIGKLLKVVKPSAFKSSVVNDAAAAKAGAARGEANLQREVAAAKAGMKDAKTPADTNRVHGAVAAAYRRFGRFEEAGDYLVQVGLPEEAVRESWGESHYSLLTAKAEATQWTVLKAHRDAGGRFGRAAAFWHILPKHPEILKDYFDNVFFATIKPTDTNGMRRAIATIFDELGRGRLYMVGQRFAASTAVYEQLLPRARTWNVTVPALCARNLFEAYAILGKDRAAADAAKEGLKDPKASPELRAFFALGERLVGWRGDEKGAAALAGKVLADLKDVKNEDRVKGIQLVGSVLYGARRENAVRGLEAYRLSLYKPEPKKRYVVKFSEETITGLSDMERLAAEEAVYDRVYGGDMEFLVTDVTTGNRGATGTSDDKLPPPSMKVAADSQGLHVLVTVKDPKAKEVELGFVGDYSFEGYIAPGANTPYYCVMAEALGRKLSVFNTSYNAPGAHYLDKAEFGTKIRFDRVYRADRAAFYFFYSWENWATRLPKNGSVWDYENMCWHRSGNNCWNGTKSIHGRSTWGELQFELTDAQRASMLRPLLARSFASYEGEKSKSGQTAIRYWKDDRVLGDPAFYRASLKPLVDDVNRLGGLFKADTSDATVLWLEREALPRWHDVHFVTDRLRARYLTDRACGADR